MAEAKAATDIASMSFEDALAQLEQIVHKLEAGDVPLEDSIRIYERGAALKAHCEKKLNIKLGESTPDGRIFLKREEECLAACTGAPMMMVDHVFHEYLTPEKVDQVLDELK